MADVAGAPCYTGMVLHFWCFLFLQNRWSARNSPRVSSTDRGLQSRMCGSKVQTSTFGNGGGMLQGSAHDKVGPNGCGTKRRTPASGRWSSGSVAHGVVMKGVNLGFISGFFEIPTQLPSIYSGFGLIILCACRALSSSSQIRLGFNILFNFVEISASDVSISVMTQRRVGDDWRWVAPRPCTTEAGAGSARPAGSNSAHGQIKTRKSLLNFQIFSKFQTNLNSIQI
jgi:hypothetical protein